MLLRLTTPVSFPRSALGTTVSERGVLVAPMRNEILAYKRERILEEAVKLFYERGFSGTTLDDIATELGVTKPFIYTHFRSKTDLLAALCKPTTELSREAVATGAKWP